MARLMIAERIVVCERDLRRRLHKMEDLAFHDHLTGIYSRGYFFKQVEPLLQSLQSQSMPLSILMIDIDHFQQINERQGYLVGDTVLNRVAQLLGDNLPSQAVLARYGGDEFIAALPGCDNLNVIDITEYVRAAVETSRLEIGLHRVSLTVSVGIAVSDADTTGLMQLVEQADHALYYARRRGQNRAMLWQMNGAVSIASGASLNMWTVPHAAN
jgi:diguanylate cyclase (GGDEF)-like protein